MQDVITIQKRTIYHLCVAYFGLTLVFIALMPYLEYQACHVGDGVSSDDFDPIYQPVQHLIAGSARFSCDMLRNQRREVLAPLKTICSNLGGIFQRQVATPHFRSPQELIYEISESLELTAAARRRPEYD